MWEPTIPDEINKETFQSALAIAYAENECVEAYFPANNPIRGATELFVGNPMTPLNPGSFWSAVLRPSIDKDASQSVRSLVGVVDGVFQDWRGLFKGCAEIPVSYEQPYFIGSGRLTRNAGLI